MQTTNGRRFALFAVSLAGGAGSALLARRTLGRVDAGSAHGPATEPGRVMLAAAALHGAAFAFTHNSLEAARIAARSKRIGAESGTDAPSAREWRRR